MSCFTKFHLRNYKFSVHTQFKLGTYLKSHSLLQKKLEKNKYFSDFIKYGICETISWTADWPFSFNYFFLSNYRKSCLIVKYFVHIKKDRHAMQISWSHQSRDHLKVLSYTSKMEFLSYTSFNKSQDIRQVLIRKKLFIGPKHFLI